MNIVRFGLVAIVVATVVSCGAVETISPNPPGVYGVPTSSADALCRRDALLAAQHAKREAIDGAVKGALAGALVGGAGGYTLDSLRGPDVVRSIDVYYRRYGTRAVRQTYHYGRRYDATRTGVGVGAAAGAFLGGSTSPNAVQSYVYDACMREQKY